MEEIKRVQKMTDEVSGPRNCVDNHSRAPRSNLSLSNLSPLINKEMLKNRMKIWSCSVERCVPVK